MATKTTDPQQASAPVLPAAPATPSHGGSYQVDEQTGAHKLVEQTQPSAGRAGAANATKN